METLFNTIISAFGWGIFHSLWQGAIIYGLLFLILTTVPRINPRLKHNLAFGSICLMFGSFLFSFVSILQIPVAPSSINLAQPMPLPLDASKTAEATGFATLAEGYFPYLVGLYAFGLLVQIAILIYSYRKLEQVKHAQHEPVPALWQQRFQMVLARLKISRAVQFKLSDQVNVPLVIGFFKPIILFPVGMVTQLDIQQVEAILIHELSHVRRNDYLLNLIKTGIETALFFNPFVWLSSRFIRIEREHDCDDQVLKFTGTPLTYAHALLKIEILKEKETPALSLAASGGSQHLYHRIKRITDMKTTYMNVKQRIFAVSLTLGTIISLAWVSPAKDKTLVTTGASGLVKQVERVSFGTAQVETTTLHATVRRPGLAADTTKKKKKVKIITVDEKGNKKEYNSVSELPDSLKDEGFPTDSPVVIAFNGRSEPFAQYSTSPEEQAKWAKLGLEMHKKGEEFAKRFNTPEERAKWEKLGLEMQQQGARYVKLFNSPEEQAKRKELTESLKKHAEELRLKMNSPEQREELRKLNDQIRQNSKELQKMMMSPEVEKQLKTLKFNFRTDPDVIESIALRNSEDYKKLKKEFDEKVEKLKKKQEKKKS